MHTATGVVHHIRGTITYVSREAHVCTSDSRVAQKARHLQPVTGTDLHLVEPLLGVLGVTWKFIDESKPAACACIPVS